VTGFAYAVAFVLLRNDGLAALIAGETTPQASPELDQEIEDIVDSIQCE
jgi:hypothetical protein